MPGARIGARCSLGQNSFVGSRAVIGDGCKIQNNVSLYDAVVLEDEVFVGPSAVFTNVVVPRAFIERKHDYAETRVWPGSQHRRQRDHRVRAHDRGVRDGGRGRGGHPRRAGVMPWSPGCPRRRMGWVCRCGHRLVQVTSDRWRCSECQSEYLSPGGDELQPVNS